MKKKDQNPIIKYYKQIEKFVIYDDEVNNSIYICNNENN